jgi:hypothetical protein
MTTTVNRPPAGPTGAGDTGPGDTGVGESGAAGLDGGPDAGAAGLFAEAMSAVDNALSEVAEVPMFGLTGGQLTGLVCRVSAVTARLVELQTRLVAEADARELGRDAGCSSTTSWLRHTTGMSGSAAGQLAGLARAFTPTTAAGGGEAGVLAGLVGLVRTAWADGRLSADRARVAADAIGRLSVDVDPERATAAVTALLAGSGELTFEEFRQAANHLVAVVDPDAADQILGDRLAAEEARAVQQATFRFARRGDGSTTVSGRLPDLHADMLKKALEALAAPRRRTARDGQPAAPEQNTPEHTAIGDTAPEQTGPGETGPAGSAETGAGHSGPGGSAEAGLGGSPVVNPDGDHSGTEIGPLPYTQRLGRALMELVEHLPTDVLPQSGGVNASVTVLIDLATLTSGVGAATLDTGGQVSAGQARRLACNAGIVPAVLGGDSTILDLGQGRRLFDRHQRAALTARDRGCCWRGCDRPPAWCEAHHLTPWSRGGPTDLDNGGLFCGFHHRLLHGGDWDARLAPDGIVEVIPPARIDPTRAPIRHQRHRHRQPD